MAVQNDPDLDTLFREELTERSASLADGAAAIIAGTVDHDLAATMVREGHTIKGTGRVMGHEAIARGGEVCEVVWRWIQHDELQPTAMLGRALSYLGDALPAALDGPSDEISGAIDAIRTLVADPARLAELPEPVDDVRVELRPAPASAPEPTLKAVEPPDELPHDVGPAVEAIAPDPVPEPVPQPDPEPDPEPVRETRVVTQEPTTRAPSDEIVIDTYAVPTGPLVFEPGPDGRLDASTITLDLIKSAFEGGSGPSAAPTHRPQPDASAAGVGPGSEFIDISIGEIEGSVLDAEYGPAFGLGGLAGVVETWAAEESVPVNAGRLFRLINDVAALRMDMQSLSTFAGQVLRSAEARSIPSAEAALESIETVRREAVELQERALGLTAVSLSALTSTLPQLMKYISKKCDKVVDLVVEGDEAVVDRQMIDRIGEVIRQLVINAVVHGIETPADRVKAGKAETGKVSVRIATDEQHVTIEVADDGGGIDWTAVRETALGRGILKGDPSNEDLRTALFSENFSTNPRSSEFTADGDGLSRISQIVEEVYGSLTMSTSPEGVVFTITMPAHRALQRALLFHAGERSWGLPESTILAQFEVGEVDIEVSERGSMIRYDKESIPYASFATAAGLEIEGMPASILVIQSPVGPMALSVDSIQGVYEVATKDLGPLLSGATVVTGVALLGGDDTVLLVDAGRLASNLRNDDTPRGPVSTVLVVDDSQGVRQVVSGVLASHGFATLSAGSVAEALGVLAESRVDGLVVDFSMPRADGVALIHLVRQRYGEIPIIMLSGVASDEDRDRAERAGANAFFDKSDFARGALVETLSELIREKADAGA
ncbi:MAG: response regulator [Acidimicrobiia bacterium]